MAHTVHLDLEPEVEKRVKLLAGLNEDVLITGPTGSGKSAVARRIHELSGRRNGPFIVQNCGAIPGELAESTLFGHERGAFTHAHTATPGVVAAADGGTLFLDEIGDVPLPVQVKLLTLLQDRVYRPLGSVKDRSASFRLIAATNRDLLERCNQGHFREDLYHRINVLPLALRPLREAPEQAQRIAADEVMRSLPPELGAQVLSAVKRLSLHPAAWPGNVRELLAFVRRCILGVDAEEARTLADWARWRGPEVSERLTAVAPSVSPSLAEQERYAGVIHELAGRGARPKAAFSREGSLRLASRLLDVFPAPLPLDDVQTVLGARDRRTIAANVELLVQHGLVQRSTHGIVASWPPATSMVFGFRQGEWSPAGPGVIPSLSHRDRVRVEVTSKRAGLLGVMLVTHRPGGSSTPAVLVEGKELSASKTKVVEIALDGEWGLEQILVHVRPFGRRGGRLVEPLLAEGIMPDSGALEQGRRMVLERWHDGWLAEHLVLHTPGK